MTDAKSEKVTIDRARVHHIAKLAALSLTDAEADKFAQDLVAIVGYVEELNTLDTTDIPPTASIQLGVTEWRPDAVLPGIAHDDALAQAPSVEHEGFAVPGFVES